ncbi:hypothetical protein JTB14_024862 [Gonioctena quinquepunctata]|nr:hypothetical protein JTB14_024862 [Gonioctena quinquepunctata]
MPKKFATENTKAVEARERKKQVKEETASKKKKEVDDAYWKDDDKQLQKKQQKKEAEEKKRLEALRRKADAKLLLEKELEEVPKKAVKPPPKLTRAQIGARVVIDTDKQDKKEKLVETHLDVPLIENINRIQIDGEEARTVEEAISVLGNKEDIDKHPEKRMKAAYNAFEERRLEELRIENPTLRLSQWKQMIFKEWQKSPENPLNRQ